MVDVRRSPSPPARENRPLGLTRADAARCRALAISDAIGVVAGARGLAPWTRASSLPPVADPKVFVVGCPRSGTTWVADILARHPHVVRGGESHLYPAIFGSIGKRGRTSVAGWAQLLYGVERGARLGRNAGVSIYVDRRTLAGLGRAVLAEVGTDDEAVDRLVRAVLDRYFIASGGASGDVLVEKTPVHLLYAERILSTFPEARVIEVVRDGRDVCVSMQLRGTRVPAWPSARSDQIDLWVRSVRLGMALRAHPDVGHRVALVRYEDLKRDPFAGVERLFDAAGLGATPDLVANAVAATDIDRYPTGPGEFHHRGEVGTWVEHFSAEDARLFKRVVGDRFAEMGYAYD